MPTEMRLTLDGYGRRAPLRSRTTTAGLLGALVLIASLPARATTDPIVRGLDHVPVAVNDLEQAATRFRQLGFVLKPGRPHANGLRNLHAKFPDGTEIELITAPAPVDVLTTQYREHLAQGDGPAFLGLFVPRPRDVVPILAKDGFATDPPAGSLIALNADGPAPYLFFAARQASPTDRPEHFSHRNTATSLEEVWLARDSFDADTRVFRALGAQMQVSPVEQPLSGLATRVQFPGGAVVLLPKEAQLVPDRPIVGLVVTIADIARTADVLGASGIPMVFRAGNRLLVAPNHTAGFWLEFRRPQ